MSSPWPSAASATSTIAPSTTISEADQQQLSHILTDAAVAHIAFTIKWKSNVYRISLPTTATLGLLKTQLSIQTAVRAPHQKLLLKSRINLTDETALADVANGASALTLVMVGSPAVDDIMAFDNKQLNDDVIDDFDIDYTDGTQLDDDDDTNDTSATDTPIASNPKYLAKLAEYSNKLEITYIAPLRAHINKLLVLDLDYTLFDMHGESNDYTRLRRPFTHRFLTSAYQHYELVIWSQTSWRWLELKLTELGMLTHPNYRIMFVVDKTCMFRVESKLRRSNKRQHLTHDTNNNNSDNNNTNNNSDNNNNNNLKRKHYVKPLALIWKHVPKFNTHNTIHIDDLSRNFAMNPSNGLKIKAYKNSTIQRSIDRELIGISKYLNLIATREKDLSSLKHDQWESYVMKYGNNIPSIDQQASGYISD